MRDEIGQRLIDTMEPGEQFRNALFLGDFEDGSEDWMALRTGRYGGSTLGTLAGVGFTSAYVEWFNRFKGVPRDKIDPDFDYWGHALEVQVADRFEKENPQWYVELAGSWEHADCPLRLANPDRLIFDKQTDELVGIEEIKTTEMGKAYGKFIATKRVGVYDLEIVPEKYYLQAQSYMDAFEVDFAVLTVLKGGCRYGEALIEYDGKKDERNQLVIDFEESGKNDIQPEYDGSKSTGGLIRANHPEIDPNETYEITSKQFAALAAGKELAANGEEMYGKIKHELMDKAGASKAKKLTYNGITVAQREARGAGLPYLSVKI